MKILSSINYYINIAKNKYTTVSYSVCLGCCGKIMANWQKSSSIKNISKNTY